MHGLFHVTLFSTYLLNNENYNSVSYRLWFHVSQFLVSNIWYFYLIKEAATKGLLWKIGLLTILAKSLKKICEIVSFLLITLKTVGDNPIKMNSFLGTF